ncbi:TetR/AcrR family transcriptional regulator [Desertibaculum subflavum]|uniref:TetR/AcrR family transcriptional regulator n=1 Tax=Desertibaculum subflavum TaxID=2268458 RepID=UPI0034D33568
MPTSSRAGSPRRPRGGKPPARYHHGDLRSALLAAGRAMLAETGPSALSLRELARRLGVSHNAPYKHFATREALLAALAAEGFKALGTRSREATGGSGDPEAMGLAYIGFALDEPAVYRLMFSDAIDKAAFPDLQAASRASFDGLRGAMERAVGPERAAAAAVSAWALVHGLSLLLLDDQIPAALSAGRSKVEVARLVLRAFGRKP